MINAETGSYALGVFIVPMGDELGISRLQFSFIPLTLGKPKPPDNQDSKIVITL